MRTPTESRILTTADVCERFKITKHTLTRWIQAGVFPRPFAPGKGKMFWSAAVIDRLLDGDGAGNGKQRK
jgi:predicted DNA-binding transcriptional regulator AlpA